MIQNFPYHLYKLFMTHQYNPVVIQCDSGNVSLSLRVSLQCTPVMVSLSSKCLSYSENKCQDKLSKGNLVSWRGCTSKMLVIIPV